MDKIKFSGVRGEEGLKEVEFDYNGRTIHAAVVSGLGNADALMKKIQKGEVHYDLLRLWHAARMYHGWRTASPGRSEKQDSQKQRPV